jgi:hypothetical protein
MTTADVQLNRLTCIHYLQVYAYGTRLGINVTRNTGHIDATAQYCYRCTFDNDQINRSGYPTF